jgi:phosphate:Na+ symporter
MSTTVSVLGGVGLFLLGMTVMTGGLKGLAGSALRTVLGKAAATPLSGVFWGAVVTLIVQSSSATTMSTIGLVSAGLLTFPQGLALVFGANIGTTGTGWLVALIGVRISLTAISLPMIFIGALIKLLGRRRVSAGGAALAGFALVLFGLMTLQQGMDGLAEHLHPSDLPSVLGSPGMSWWAGMLGVLMLVGVGLAMTAVMQSSTAAIAVTLSAHFAGAIGVDQACALIIGQNIGTATSSAMAAIGASHTAQRLALAYILFKLIAAAIALVLFPFTTPLLIRVSHVVEGVTLLAAYHTAYNVIGVAVLLPLIDQFTRLMERILPPRDKTLTQCLDPAALITPIAAVEAVRRTTARSLRVLCGAVENILAIAGDERSARSEKRSAAATEAADALREAQIFISDVSGPPESEEEQQRLTSTLHALDHASRMAVMACEENGIDKSNAGPEEARAARLCAEAMQIATSIADEVVAPHVPRSHDKPAQSMPGVRGVPNSPATSIADAVARLKQSSKELDELQRNHRLAMLGAAGNGTLTAGDAIARVEMVRRLDRLTHHAWRSLAHLVRYGP